MAEEKKLVYILHGDDYFAIRKQVDAFVKKMGDPSLAELNISHLDGKNTSEDDLRSAAYAMPFLTDRRLVILTNPLARFSAHDEEGDGVPPPDTTLGKKGPGSEGLKKAREQFLALLEKMPDSTAVVMVIEDTNTHKKNREWNILNDTHWLAQWAHRPESRALLRRYQLPGPREMPAWILHLAEECGGSFTPAGARMLADYVGADTRVAALEVDKMLNYVDYRRSVDEDDVMQLSIQTTHLDIFYLVDALGERRGKDAQKALHELLEISDGGELFGMIIRQYRLLIQAREVLDEGGGESTVAVELKVHPFVAAKMARQAARLSMDSLERTYHRLLKMDEDSKTSQMDAALALDLLVAELA